LASELRLQSGEFCVGHVCKFEAKRHVRGLHEAESQEAERTAMSEDQHDHQAARYRAMVFAGPQAMAAAEKSVTAAIDATFGIRRYTTTEGWLVGGLEGNGEANKEGPDKSPVWRQRIVKARREIEVHKTEHRVSVLAASLRPAVVTAFLRALKYD
jgi:hypothetical protein